MIVLDNIYDGNLHFFQDTDLEGSIREGNLYIHQGIYCILNGIVEYNVYIYKNALVEVNGMVEGDLYSYGGDIIISGIVKGDIHIYPHEL